MRLMAPMTLMVLVLCCLSFFTLPTFASEKEPPPEWTLLVYINGNNDLDSYGAMNINQMERVGSSDQVNIVVQWASLSRQTTQRLFIKKDDTREVVSPIVEQFNKPVDMGSWRSFVDFVQWGIKTYPAKKYFVSIWNHGSGWHLEQLDPNAMNPKDISYDDISGNFISTKEMGLALKEINATLGRKIDLFATDACLMAMLEVAHEISPYANYFAASEDTEPSEGWPYQEILSRWTQNPHSEAAEVAKIIADEYVRSYQGGSNGKEEVVFSSIDLSKIEPLVSSLARLSEELLKLPKDLQKEIVKVATRGQHFTLSPDYIDISDFVAMLGYQYALQIPKAFFSSVQDALKNAVAYNITTPKFNRAKGLSMWAPTRISLYDKYNEAYAGLQFSKETSWGTLWKELLKN